MTQYDIAVVSDWAYSNAYNIGAALLLGTAAYSAYKMVIELRGKLKMRKRTRLTKEVREIIEDIFVDALTEAIESKRVTIDDARQLYARFAHLGFWGLHPRKFSPRVTQERLDELKRQIKEKRAAVKANGKVTMSMVDKLLDGVAKELK